MTNIRPTLSMLIPALLSLFCLTEVLAQSQSPPVVLIVPGVVGDSATADSDVLDSVRLHLAAAKKYRVIAFDRENPTIARFIMERGLASELYKKMADPAVVRDLAGIVGATHVLAVHGEVSSDTVRVGLRLTRLGGRGEWSSSAESDIAQVGGPQAQMNRRNAISTAASSPVSQIDLAAFPNAQPGVESPIAVSPTVIPTVEASLEQSAPRDISAEYAACLSAADSYIGKGDLPNAIQELRQAVNLQPKTVAVRVKLADAYSAIGMPELALDELRRALLFDADDPAVYRELADFYLESGALTEAAGQLREVIRLNPDDTTARVSLGNVYWNLNRLDDAADAFNQAARLDPANPVPHERLYKLYWARKQYELAIEHLSAGRAGGAELDASSRYRIAAEVVRGQLTGILAKLKTNWQDYQSSRLSRENYYLDCSDLSVQVDEFTRYLSTLTVPDGLRAAQAHGMLCASLLSQSISMLTSFLETDKREYADQSQLFREEAAAELLAFGKAISQR